MKHFGCIVPACLKIQTNIVTIPQGNFMFLPVSALYDCSPGELWVLCSKLALPLFPAGMLQHIPRGTMGSS